MKYMVQDRCEPELSFIVSEGRCDEWWGALLILTPTSCGPLIPDMRRVETILI